MTGHIPGTTVLRRRPAEQTVASRGANHVGLRAANERLVLSLIRTHGRLSKAQIAELTGLTAQTASVISRSLVDAGLLQAGAPVRGKIGQPFVPLSLNPDGAMFFGLHVDREEARLALVNFTGSVVDEVVHPRRSADLGDVAVFARAAIAGVQSRLHPAMSARIQGVGVALASAVSESMGRGPPWTGADQIFEHLVSVTDLVSTVSSDAIAACSAELIYGLGSGLSDFIYVFVDHAIGGGLVQEGQMRFTRDVAGSNIGKVLVLGPRGELVPLWTLAEARGAGSPASNPELEELARGIAHAVHSTSAVANFDAVIIDGSITPEARLRLVTTIKRELSHLDAESATRLTIREGSSERKSIALGAACLPLVDRFFPQAATRQGAAASWLGLGC